jgi:hypothetical protein
MVRPPFAVANSMNLIAILVYRTLRRLSLPDQLVVFVPSRFRYWVFSAG